MASTPFKEYVKLQKIIYIFTTFFLTSGTWLKIVQGLDLKMPSFRAVTR
jgi:hypothetical protein